MILYRRHLRLFLIAPLNWLISILSVIVILSLYFLFIRDFTITAILDSGIISAYSEEFVDLLMIGGLIIVISATACLPICMIAIKDHEQAIFKDFQVAPITKLALHSSYIFTSFIISLFISCITFLMVLCYFKYLYYFTLTLKTFLACLLLLALNSIICATLLYIISLIFKANTTFSSFGNLFGVIIGFITGVYIPIGYYPSLIRNILFLFPPSLITSLLRNILTTSTLDKMLVNMPSIAHNEIREMFGLKVIINNHLWTSTNEVIYLISFLIALFGCLALYLLKQK